MIGGKEDIDACGEKIMTSIRLEFHFGSWSRRAALVSGHVFLALKDWQEQSRQRRALLSLDDRMLRDIGVGRSAAAAEARKPFWRV